MATVSLKCVTPEGLCKGTDKRSRLCILCIVLYWRDVYGEREEPQPERRWSRRPSITCRAACDRTEPETEGRDRAKGKRDCQDGGRACQVTREQARQAELRVYALNALIDVADETYGLGLRKVLGESDQEDPHPDPKR